MDAQSVSAPLTRTTLNGNWQLHGYQNQVLNATVPGCVHSDLLAQELIPDIHYRDNEAQMHWVYRQDWVYSRELTLTQDQLDAETLLLRCHGLDTLCSISINDTPVLDTDNMFRIWDIDLHGHVNAGTNTISIRFHQVLPYMQAGHERRAVNAWNVYNQDFLGKPWIRKMACSFGWDWGPVAPSVGIWRDIDILCSDQAWLADVAIRQQHDTDSVSLDCDLAVHGAGDDLIAQVRVSLNGSTVTTQNAALNGSSHSLQVDIPDPQLWWPLDLGAQPLYDIDIELRHTDGDVLDTCHKRIGLRQIELVREDDDAGQSFSFRVNGRDFFAKGANWVPLHNYLPAITRAHYDARLSDAADAHMNMIRVWGGGIYEDDAFYELCDEKGILVWQDFMFACSGFPFFDDGLCANITEEFADNIKRLRHHPSIALWCGNNEIEQGLVGDKWTERSMSWKDYDRVFDGLLKDACTELAPQIPYWPGSPHTPQGDRNQANDQRSGDCHLWSVWFGNQPFEAQRDWTCRFMSEFGFQSFPEPKTLNGFTEPKDRNLSSYVMDFHQRSGPGNKTIYKYIMDWFLLPKNLDETLWLSQISQGLCVKYATEHLRRLQPHNMGVLYWQINDIWPCASWASVDYHGRWKALQYMARNFFAPLLPTILENEAEWSFELHLSNHHFSEQKATMHWHISDTSGAILKQGTQTTAVGAQSNAEITRIDCSELKDKHASRDILCWVSLEQDGRIIARNFAHICKPKYITLQEPQIAADIEALTDGRIAVTLSSTVPALWTRIECDSEDIRWSDNFINLDGRESVRVESMHPVHADVKDLQDTLRFSSLYHSAWN